jgi:hypothetical protein
VEGELGGEEVETGVKYLMKQPFSATRPREGMCLNSWSRVLGVCDDIT